MEKKEGKGKHKQVTFNLRVDPALKGEYFDAVKEVAAMGLYGSGGAEANPSEVVDWMMAWISEAGVVERAGRLRVMRASFFDRHQRRENQAIPPSNPDSDGVGPVVGQHTVGRAGAPEQVAERVRARAAGRPDGDEVRPKAKRAPKGSVN